MPRTCQLVKKSHFLNEFTGGSEYATRAFLNHSGGAITDHYIRDSTLGELQPAEQEPSPRTFRRTLVGYLDIGNDVVDLLKTATAFCLAVPPHRFCCALTR